MTTVNLASTKSRVVTAATLCAPNSGAASNSKSRLENAVVSIEEQADASECIPSAKIALTLSKSSPVPSTRAIPSNRLMDKPKSYLSAVSERHMPSVVSTKQMVSKRAHQRIDTHSRASMPAANLRFGEIPSSLNAGKAKQPKQAVKTLGSSFELPENNPECSEEHSIQIGWLANDRV